MIRRVDGIVILDISGELTLRDKVSQEMEAGRARILLNMAGMSHLGAFGLGELVGAYAAIVKAGGEMKLLNVRPRVRRMLDAAKLCTVFELYEDEASAVRSFTASTVGRGNPGSEMFMG